MSIEAINPLDDTARLRVHREMETEGERSPAEGRDDLVAAKEVQLCDMTQEELQVVILHDPDLITRRQALRLYRIDILADAEIRIMTTLAQARK